MQNLISFGQFEARVPMGRVVHFRSRLPSIGGGDDFVAVYNRSTDQVVVGMNYGNEILVIHEGRISTVPDDAGPCLPALFAAVRAVASDPESIHYRLVRKDIRNDSESWSFHVVLDFVGVLPSGPDDMEEETNRMLRMLPEIAGITVRGEGHGGAGQPFADAPWVQWFDGWCIVSQSGGLNV